MRAAARDDDGRPRRPRARCATALDAIAELPGPVYLRVSRFGEPVPGLGGAFALGRAGRARATGATSRLIALGPQAHAALARRRAAARREGSPAAVAVVSSFNPSPDEDLRALLGGSAAGGHDRGPLPRSAGSARWCRELVAEAGLGDAGAPARRRGDAARPRPGSEAFLARRLGLDPPHGDRRRGARRPAGGLRHRALG